MSTDLVPQDLGPGLVPTGWAEWVLEQSREVDDPERLWDAATTCAALAQKWNGHGREKNEIKTAQMFVEVELGQRLGPNPGAGAHNRLNPHADSPGCIPPQLVSGLRRFYGHRDMLVEAVRNGARSRRSLLLAVDLAEAEDRGDVEVEDLDIRRGDFREVLGDIDPDSIALILTDPPYPTEYLPLWSDLSKFGAQNLVDGGSLVAYCGQSILPEALTRLDEHLRYWWTICLTHGQTQMIPGKFVSAGWKPVLWFVKDHRRDRAMVADSIRGGQPRKTVPTGDDGTWAQSVDALASLISNLTAPGELIVDPFAGSGTTGIAAAKFGRRFIGATL